MAEFTFVTGSWACEFLATLATVTRPPGSRLNWSVEFFLKLGFLKLLLLQGFDWVFNYKTQDIGQTLNIAAPNGVRQYLFVLYLLFNEISDCYNYKDHKHSQEGCNAARKKTQKRALI